jgi:hypothetical protein
MVGVLVGVARVASGCGGETGGAPPPRTGAEAPATAAARHGVVALAFEAKKPGSRPLPFAFVEGKIGGQATRFVVDTGAPVHVVDATLASAAQLASPVNASSLSIDGWGALPEHAVVVRELPAVMRAHGIGAILSPQLLAETATDAVVIDFVNRQLRARPQSSAWSELEDLGAVLTPPGPRKFCPVDTGGVPGLVLGVDGTVDGERARLEIDSGASHTMLHEPSQAGVRAAGHAVLGRSMAASDEGDVAVAIHGGVPVRLGAWSTTLDIGVTPAAHHADCGYHGRLGIDVLQQCALAFTTEKVLVACRAPASAGH